MNELKTKLIESMEKIRWDDSQSECVNYMEIIKNTSNSLEEALDIINDYDDALNLISDEYKLLVDTIVKENMGMIWVERRELLKKIEQMSEELELAQQEKIEYEMKLEALTKYLSKMAMGEKERKRI